MLHWIALLPGEAPALDAGRSAWREDGGTALLDGADMGTAMDAELCVDAGGCTDVGSAPAPLSADHLAWWCLQFTPRVALLKEAVVLEIQASERLFGGRRMLRRRIATEAAALGILAWAHAGTALAALALARQARHARQAEQQASQNAADNDNDDDGAQASHLASRLDELPLHVLPGVAEHHPTLVRMGCQTLGQVRHLPRGGLSRRFGANLLRALDQAYGLVAETCEWVTLPPTFDARLELPGRVEAAPELLFAAQRLIQQLCAWLAGRQAGIAAFTLRWLHDWHRREDSREGQWTIRLASPTRDPMRLGRLLAEHLQRIELASPVCDLGLHADEIEALPISSQALFQELAEDHLSAAPDALITPAAQKAQRDALLALLDRLSVRLGAERVLQARIQADHRIECAQTWGPAIQVLQQPSRASSPPSSPSLPSSALVARWPQPCWVLAEPLHLSLASDGHGLQERPVYQGRLTLLAGPHRIEAGWWDTPAGHPLVTRDYYLASSEKAGLLWIFKARHAPDDQRSPWYLHGFFG